MRRTASAFVNWITAGLVAVLAVCYLRPFFNGMKRSRNDHRLAGKKRGEKRRVTFCSAEGAGAPAKKARTEAAAAKRAGEVDRREKTRAAEAKKVAAAERRSIEKRRAAAAAKKATLEVAAAAKRVRAKAAAVKRENETAEKTKAAEAKKVATEEAAAAKQAQLMPAMSYKGWRDDADAIERMHIECPEEVPGALRTMRRKQQLHDGDRSHRYIQKLDALTPTLTYPGWEKDARAIEWPQAPQGCSIFFGGPLGDRNHRFDYKLESMRSKQQDSVRGPSSPSRSHENLRNLDKIVAKFELVPAVAYKAWRDDADAIERMHIDHPNRVPDALRTMRRKQQLHTGDRSHRYIRKLDALTPTLTYSAWEEDARELEWPQPKGSRMGLGTFFALCVRGEDIDAGLERMRRKQDIVCGRSHKNLRKLDEISAYLERVPAAKYKDWQLDADAIEHLYIECPHSVSAALRTMLRKQQLQIGDRSHQYIRKLDALIPTLTYSGWEGDVSELEWPQAGLSGLSLSVTTRDFDTKLERMRRKQDSVGGRSHANLRNLDEAVARLARGMQIPPSSAPSSNSASSSVLWDAKELPIESLIECILGGKTCALSCLGLQPGLCHPPEEIRTQFKVLALRVHPDKESHPRAEEAFVVVRAAYERLSRHSA